MMRLDQEEAKQWCRRNPGVVLQCHYYWPNTGHGISWNGTEFRFWKYEKDIEKLYKYGSGGIYTWSVATWSPTKPKRPVVGGI